MGGGRLGRPGEEDEACGGVVRTGGGPGKHRGVLEKGAGLGASLRLARFPLGLMP